MNEIPLPNPPARSVTVQLPERGAIRRSLIWAAGFLVLAYVLYTVREIVLPIGLAFLTAMILDPVVDRMEMRGWSRARASAFIFGAFLSTVIVLTVLAIPYMTAQIAALQAGFEKQFPDSSHDGLIRSFRHMGMSDSFSRATVSLVENTRASLQKSSTSLSDYGMSAFSNAIWIVIVPIVAFYALRDFHTILAKALLLVSPKRRDLVQTVVSEVTGVFAKYLRGLAIVSVCNGIATALLLMALRVPGGLVVGVMAGVLYSVPYIGALITILLTAAVAFVGGGLHLTLVAVGASVVLHQVVFDQIISPRILGGHVGLHPILSIIALLVGQMLLGIPGMILGVPVAACIQMAVLATVPKLSKEVTIAAPTSTPSDTETVESLEEDIKETHQRIGATEEMHAAVTAAVQSIDEEAAATD
ncbi:MAG TPA: AI-2E family transporter [Fimbriimonas sp.]|nr:AI-2E family transporter [Fimbriimonas sp.]